MTIRHANHIIAGADGVHRHATTDVIEHEGTFWLVPEWLENHVQKLQKPQRIISLATMEFQRNPGVDPEFVVSMPIPISVFEGRVRPGKEGKYVVVEAPNISFPLEQP